MKQINRIPFKLPPRSDSTRTNIQGKAFQTIIEPRRFPRSSGGMRGTFTTPAELPTATGNSSTDFSNLVNHYVQWVGGQLKKLNALQFNLTEENHPDTIQEMSDELGKLADKLNVGDAAKINPPTLNWPLAGLYTLQQDLSGTDFSFTSFTVEIYFDNEATFRLVTNCTINVTANTTAEAGISSSTSFVAPGSSK